MFTKSALLALAAASLASAQTHTLCNPLEKTCPADAAFGNEKVDCDLTKGPCKAFFELEGTKLEYNDKGAVFSIVKDTNAPTISTHKYIFFGRLDVEVQAALGAGIVTSLVLQSDDLDEIDWEWVGGDDANVQTNYFYKGDTTTYDRGAFHPVANSLTQYHKYSIEYTPKAVKWFVDDAVVRTLTYEEANGGKHFPQTPMQIKLGTWVAGAEGKPEGTIEWAGGLTDFKKAPFNAYYKSIVITDYAGGDAPTDKSVKEYVYGDKSGTYQSIDVVMKDGSSEDNEDDKEDKDDKTTSKAAEATSTKKEETKSAEPTSSKKEETKSAEPTKSASKTPDAASSTTLATSKSAANTPVPTPSSPATTSAPAGGAGDDEDSTSTGPSSPSNTPDAPEAAANSLSLGSALVVGAGLLVAQLLL